MNKLDYWLLDAVVTTPLPLSWLTAANVSTLLNRPTHGASPATLATALIRLCAEGWLGVYADPDFNEWVDLPALPLAEDIYATLKNTVDGSYALTADGGRQWEALAQPDWRRYVVKYEMDTTRLVSGSQQHLQTYVDLYPYGNSGEILVANSITWQSIQPWRATYWKTLPVGYQATFQVMAQNHTPVPAWAMAKWQDLQEWYTNPFADNPA